MDESRAVVVEMGSTRTRVGFAGDDKPMNTYPTVIAYGSGDEEGATEGAGEGGAMDVEGDESDDVYYLVGQEGLEASELADVRWPMRMGTAFSSDDVERMWSHIYANELNIVSEDHAVLVSDSPWQPRRAREELAHLLFETFGAPAVYMSMQPLMSLYAAGSTSGVVVDCGATHCTVCPVSDGNVIASGMMRLDIGGTDLTLYLEKLLRESSASKEGKYSFLSSPSALFHVRAIKEKLGFSAFDYQEALTTPLYQCPVIAQDRVSVAPSIALPGSARSRVQRPLAPGELSEYELPSGQKVQIDQERYKCSEALFNPSMIGRKTMGIHHAVEHAVWECDVESRAEVAQTVVLAGGGSMFPGLKERLQKEVRALMPSQNYSVDTVVSAPKNRDISSWLGGSIVGTLSGFLQMSLSRQEYDEHGPSGIHRRCFA